MSAVNDAPVAVDDAAATAEDTAVAKDVIANDTDVDNTNAQLSVKPGSLNATNGPRPSMLTGGRSTSPRG